MGTPLFKLQIYRPERGMITGRIVIPTALGRIIIDADEMSISAMGADDDAYDTEAEAKSEAVRNVLTQAKLFAESDLAKALVPPQVKAALKAAKMVYEIQKKVRAGDKAAAIALEELKKSKNPLIQAALKNRGILK